MPHQIAVTIRAPVRTGALESLKAALDDMSGETRRTKLLPFEDLPVHFARFVVLDDATDLEGRAIPASLMFFADVDSPDRRFLHDLCETAGDGLDELFGHCEDYPEQPTSRQRGEYLRRHAEPAATAYVNTVGRSLHQVRGEAQLRDGIEGFLDRHDWAGQSAVDVRRAVIAFVAGDQTLSWALRRPRRPSLWWRAGEVVHLVFSAVVLFAALPFALAALPFFAVALRIHERREKPSTRVPDPDHVEQLAAAEDVLVQNQFSAVGFVKPNAFRRLTLTAVLWLIELSVRHVYNKGRLAGVRTIHFARWVFLDDKRRLIFISNYDGSLESYMDDFIDKVAWGLNAAFSNGEGYPRTRWLLFGGAKDERAFKNYLRDHQIPSPIWYSAYGDLTAVNITNNAAIRRGLRGDLSDRDAERWAARL